jgi:hypothetical protein
MRAVLRHIAARERNNSDVELMAHVLEQSRKRYRVSSQLVIP